MQVTMNGGKHGESLPLVRKKGWALCHPNVVGKGSRGHETEQSNFKVMQLEGLSSTR
jgi:hypothetical protein